MAHWLIELNGSEIDLNILSKYLSTEDLAVVEENQVFMLRVPTLGEEGNPATIFDDVKDVMETVNGAAKVFYPRFQGVDFNKVILVDDEGSRKAHVFLTAPERDLRLYAFREYDSRLSDWIEAALENDAIARAFSIYGSLEHNWKNLFMVVEVIQESLGGESFLIDSGIVASGKLKLFKTTANNFLVVGKDARHARTDWRPPSNPMTLQEARDFVGELLRGWLDLKI